MTAPISVAVVDDQALLRASLEALLSREPDLHVVGSAGDGDEALDLVRATHPDIVLMDITMPRRDGLSATRAICSDPALTGVRVLILTMDHDSDHVFQALRVGASGFVLKDTAPAALVDAVRRVHAGEMLLSPAVLTGVVAQALRQPARAPRALSGLTPREVEVLRLVALGQSNTQIEDTLVISRGTVKTHIGRLLSKLGARDRAQLVIAAYEAGLVAVGG